MMKLEKSETIQTIDNFYSLLAKLGKEDFTKNEEQFLCNFELELAKSILNEFNNKSAYKLAKILLLFSDQ